VILYSFSCRMPKRKRISTRRVSNTYSPVEKVSVTTPKFKDEIRAVKEILEDNGLGGVWIYLSDVLSFLADGNRKLKSSLKESYSNKISDKFDDYQKMKFRRKICSSTSSSKTEIISNAGATLLLQVFQQDHAKLCNRNNFMKSRKMIFEQVFGTEPSLKSVINAPESEEENKGTKKKGRRLTVGFRDDNTQPKKKRRLENSGDKTKSLGTIEFICAYFQPYELPLYYKQQFDRVLGRILPKMGWGRQLTSYDFHSMAFRSEGSKRGESVVGGCCFQFSPLRLPNKKNARKGIYIWALAVDFPLQGFGFGRKCLDALLQFAKKHKIGYLWLDSATGASLEFWNHLKFQQIGKFHKLSKTYRMALVVK